MIKNRLTDEEVAAIPAALPPPPEGSAFEVEKATRVTLPHPYCITPKHVEVAADHHSGMLGEYAIEDAEKRGAKCGMRGCLLPYSSHESQVMLVIVVKGRPKDLNSVPGLHAYLLAVKDKAVELGVEGCAFPDRRGQL